MPTKHWNFDYNNDTRRGRMENKKCIVSFTITIDGTPTINAVRSADLQDPFGEALICTNAEKALPDLVRWWDRGKSGAPSH